MIHQQLDNTAPKDGTVILATYVGYYTYVFDRDLIYWDKRKNCWFKENGSDFDYESFYWEHVSKPPDNGVVLNKWLPSGMHSFGIRKCMLLGGDSGGIIPAWVGVPAFYHDESDEWVVKHPFKDCHICYKNPKYFMLIGRLR